jgi:hypothetical protein
MRVADATGTVMSEPTMHTRNRAQAISPDTITSAKIDHHWRCTTRRLTSIAGSIATKDFGYSRVTLEYRPGYTRIQDDSARRIVV